jgi:peroxiredoxin
MARAFAVGSILMVTVLVGCANTVDGGGGPTLKIGDAAPTFTDLPGVDGKTHSLGDFKQDVLVVVITCNHCPVAAAYEERMVDFAKKYTTAKDAKVGLVAINVNNSDADKLDKMKERAKDKGFNFPYLYDKTQAIAKQLNAHVTPEFYVLDKNRKLAYWGPMDDNFDAGKVKENYLAPAVDALIAGKAVTVATKKAFGCSIEYER